MNRAHIKTHAIPALTSFLLKLQVYKSTADVRPCVSLLNRYSSVDETFARYRSIIIEKAPPRIQYVQVNTALEDGRVKILEYPPTREGLIRSWVERSV